MPNWIGLKKNCQSLTHNERASLIDENNENVCLKRQCQLLGISRSSIYYQPALVGEEDKKIMDLIDAIYTKYPFYGNRRIKYELNRTHQIPIGRSHTRTLMATMGLEAIYPKKKFNLSSKSSENKIYPYLLGGLKIYRPNQVWGTDITYVKLETGFAYLVAIIDWFSRYVISWKLSNSLEIEFCLECLQEALAKSISAPDILNSDQGSHFTSPKFTSILETKKIQISMDGRGRCMDNIFTERLWRTVKQENIYLNSYQNVASARTGLNEYFSFYDNLRRHQSLNYQTPAQVHFQNLRKNF
jgi:putative transposase